MRGGLERPQEEQSRGLPLSPTLASPGPVGAGRSRVGTQRAGAEGGRGRGLAPNGPLV